MAVIPRNNKVAIHNSKAVIPNKEAILNKGVIHSKVVMQSSLELPDGARIRDVVGNLVQDRSPSVSKRWETSLSKQD